MKNIQNYIEHHKYKDLKNSLKQGIFMKFLLDLNYRNGKVRWYAEGYFYVGLNKNVNIKKYV